MRLKVTRLWRVIKRELPMQFGREQRTSYGGLELVRRYFQFMGLNARIRRALGKPAGGDYGCTHLVLLVIGLLVVGARRLQRLRYLANDPLFARFRGLARIPSDRTVVNWLKQFTQDMRVQRRRSGFMRTGSRTRIPERRTVSRMASLPNLTKVGKKWALKVAVKAVRKW